MTALLTTLLLLPTTFALPGIHFHRPTAVSYGPALPDLTLHRPPHWNRGTNKKLLSCSDASRYGLAWTAQDMSFGYTQTFTTPAHEVDDGWISLTLANSAIAGWDVETCGATVDMPPQVGFVGNAWYGCDLKGGLSGVQKRSLEGFDDDDTYGILDMVRMQTGRGDKGNGTASITFNADTGKLQVNQVWACLDENPMSPNYFNASGTTNISMSCTTSTWTNPFWSMGQIYEQKSTVCGPGNFTVMPTVLSAWSGGASAASTPIATPVATVTVTASR